MDGKMDILKGTVGVNMPTINNESVDGKFIGEALEDDAKINSLMTNHKPEIIALVGFVGYGKTSFIASFYHTLLRDGKIHDYKLFDSDTLTGLERRLFLRRYREELSAVAPNTIRTIRGEPHLLTFHLSSPQKGEKVIVISDHSGEDYQEYVDTKVKLDNDILLRNANRIIFFVDCGKLLTADMMSMRQNYLTLITNMKEYSVLSPDVKIQFLFNKIDLTEGKKDIYKSKKESFLSKMSEVLGFEITDTPEVISNQFNNKAVLDVFYDLIDNTSIPPTIDNAEINQLDWAKNFLKNN